jgi:hypothetical protein
VAPYRDAVPRRHSGPVRRPRREDISQRLAADVFMKCHAIGRMCRLGRNPEADISWPQRPSESRGSVAGRSLVFSLHWWRSTATPSPGESNDDWARARPTPEHAATPHRVPRERRGQPATARPAGRRPRGPASGEPQPAPSVDRPLGRARGREPRARGVSPPPRCDSAKPRIGEAPPAPGCVSWC